MQTKLAAIYNVWDGDELLEGSMRQIRSQVDVIIVVWSNMSNIGEFYEPRIPRMSDIGLRVQPNLQASAQHNEAIKRQVGLNLAKELGCTHFIFMDCDEFYKPEEFFSAKKEVLENDADFSYCKLKTYYKTPTRQLKNEENYYVPFICKLNNNTSVHSGGFPVFCDPTRAVKPAEKLHCVDWLRMHHYSFVRKDIARKMRNSSSAQAFKNVNMELWNDATNKGEMIYFGNQETIEVENYFRIEL